MTLREAHHAWRDWLFEDVLPVWSTTGRDRPGLGFIEHLTLDGQPVRPGFKRMRVQARQIYVFSQAALLGWTDGMEAAADGLAFIRTHGWLPEGGWARRLGDDGGIVDPVADLYDHAFVLFALAWYARASGDATALDLARQTLEWVCEQMAIVDGTGFENATPATNGPREQNPHMHLLEAVLALHEVSGEASFADLARQLLTLFCERLFDAATGTIPELFAGDWSKWRAETVVRLEPGHHYEWVWLLRACERQLGVSVSKTIAALYDFANRNGVDPARGLVFDIVSPDGAALDRGTRVWPQTEAIKAHLVNNDAAHPVGPLAARVKTTFFDPAPRGCWLDHFGPAGELRADKIPASTLYHVMMAFAELDRSARPA